MKAKLSDREIRLDILVLKSAIENLERDVKNLEERVRDLEAQAKPRAEN